jgi:hypothetical protein
MRFSQQTHGAPVLIPAFNDDGFKNSSGTIRQAAGYGGLVLWISAAGAGSLRNSLWRTLPPA